MRLRACLAGAVALCLGLALLIPGCSRPPKGGNADALAVTMPLNVEELARGRAARPWTPPVSPLPRRLLELNYDQYRMIAPRPHRALWRDSGRPFEIAFYHPGYLFPMPVDVYTIGPGGTAHVPFDPERFDYHLEGGRKYSKGVDGYAGILAYYPFDDGPYREAVSFLGATYFRAIGSGHLYGTSARGLAVNPVASREESFPRFTDFWVVEPRKGESTLVVHAIAEDEALTASYRFDITPGDATVVEVSCRLFVREDIEQTGLAPLTSMFFHGHGSDVPGADPRPRVHDAEGLLLRQRGGEWIYRPLRNPAARDTALFAGNDLRAWGLIQRHTDPADYQDPEALYHRRPSVWVEPLEGFASGDLLLMELPAAQEGVDSILAAWVPRSPLKAGEERPFRWRLTFQTGEPADYDVARAMDFEAARAADDDTKTEYRVHFRGGFLDGPEARAGILAEVSGTDRELITPRVETADDGTATLTFRVPCDARGDIQASIRSARTEARSETWVHRHECP